MSSNEWEKAHSFRVGCPVSAAYVACLGALAGMPNIDVGNADDNVFSIEASVRRTLWSRGEELRILIHSGGDAEAVIEIGCMAKKQDKDRCNYDDVECAVRCRISRLEI